MDVEVYDSKGFDAAAMPPELLQVLGSNLSPVELRNARLVCKPWATALAVCMPIIKMSLPLHTPGNIFRQPLVLCSSGQLNSAQSLNFSAAPLPRTPVPSQGQSARLAGHSSLAGAAPPPRHGSGSSKASKPSPFATKGGQAAMKRAIGDLAPTALPVSAFLGEAASLPPACLPRMDQTTYNSTAAAAAAASTTAAAIAPQSVVQWQNSGMMQSWSSLPSAGLRTCSSLQQLHLQLSGAPPTPQDLMDLSRLPHLTHLSFRQVEGLPACPPACPTLDLQPAAEPVPPATGDWDVGYSAASSSSSSTAAENDQTAAVALAADGVAAAAMTKHRWHSCDYGSSNCDDVHFSASAYCRTGRSSCSSLDELVGLSGSDCSSAMSDDSGHSIWGTVTTSSEADADTCSSSSSVVDTCADTASDTSFKPDQGHGEIFGSTAPLLPAPTLFGLDSAACSNSSCATECVSCSVITPYHIEALAQLPHLSSLELHPKHGTWDAAATAALLKLTMLTGLTKLSLTWGSLSDVASSVSGPMSDAHAVQQALNEQLPLQQCLLGLAPQLHELELHGCAVVDVAVIQNMQKLRVLKAEALKVVNSDVVQRLQEGSTAAGGDTVQAGLAQSGSQAAAPGGAIAVQQQQQHQRRTPKWATLQLLETLHVVHPASDISTLLQGTQTPALSSLGFVSRGPSDFARLLGQHGKLKVLHLVFPEDESWHPIAVVRLPTALPSLRSLTLEGKFWLPNSLIVALGVMEVPIEELSLRCKLAPPCLERLQHLKQLRRLSLHHVAWAGHPADGLVTKDVMLQLPAKLLPPELTELEITNGWILQ